LEQSLILETKYQTMTIKKQLLVIFSIANTSVISYSQTNTTIDQRIEQVENSLAPLVLRKDQSLWKLKDRMHKYNTKGLSIAVIHDYIIEWAKGYGETGNPIKPDITEQTVFQAASMSKFVNAVAMMRLKELNKIDLDKDINQYLTSWKFPYNIDFGEEPITLRQLLNHTAGLSVHGFRGYWNSEHLPSIVQILNGIKPSNSEKVVQILPANSEFKYSGGGVTISQLIISDNSKVAYERFVNENVFTPLGMDQSFYSIELDKYPEELAFAHSERGKLLSNNYNIYPESAAAGLWTTPTDLGRLIIDFQMCLSSGNGKILAKDSATEIIEPTLEGSISALGLFREIKNETLYLQHSGANRGFRGKFIFSADNGNGVVVMSNGTNTEIIEEIIRSVGLVYEWPGFETLTVSTTVELNDIDLRKYAGTYIKGNRAIEVRLKRNKLLLEEKGKWKSNLTSLNGTTFVVDIVKPQATIEFVKNSDGKVVKCIMEQGDKTEWVKQH